MTLLSRLLGSASIAVPGLSDQTEDEPWKGDRKVHGFSDPAQVSVVPSGLG
jgi:hypothetical protein